MRLAVLPRMIGRGLKRFYRGVVPKYNQDRRNAVGRMAGTAVVVVGAATGATSLGALLGACKEKAPSSKVKEKSDAVKPPSIEIVAESHADGMKKTAHYGFYISEYSYSVSWSGVIDWSVVIDEMKFITDEMKSGKITARREKASVVIDPKRVKNVKFVKRGKFIVPKGRYRYIPKGRKASGRLEELRFQLPQRGNDIMAMRGGYYWIDNLQIEKNDGIILNITLKIKVPLKKFLKDRLPMTRALNEAMNEKK